MQIADFKERIPLLKPEWVSMLKKIGENINAPYWNTQCGDRLTSKDMVFINDFEGSLKRREVFDGIPDSVIEWILKIKTDSIWFEKKLKDLNIKTDFTEIPFMTRADLQSNIEQIVPQSISLERLIVNPTSGTTGQPVLCPNHPSATGCYDPMIQFMLQQHGVIETYDHNTMAAIQLCAQQHTITYYTVHSFLNGAGFAKINIMTEHEWPDKNSPSNFIKELEPVFLSGDPIAFYYAAKMDLNYKPKALLSTAVSLGKELRKKIEQRFACPLIDFYSLNETGPLAYSCPLNPDTFHVLPHDIYIEIIDRKGRPLKEGEIGEITVTGGRNPYIPLLRYRTGDLGTMDSSECECGDRHPKLSLKEARKPVLFFDLEHRVINPVDISRILRNYPVKAHQMIQYRDRTCRLNLAFFCEQLPVPGP